MPRRFDLVTLVVLDGWGLAPDGPGNAVALADTPVFDRLWEEHPHTTLIAKGESVGLPAGQMGNSEVGHLNLGAGAIVPQDLARIDRAVEDGSLADNEILRDAMRDAERVHLIGLVSDGGVHALQVLEEDPAGADRQVTDLGVAHLAGRQADRLAGRRQPRVRVLVPEPVEHRRAGQLDRVARPGRRAAPPVEDHERYEVDAARQIAAKESGSSEAPPTSAPSIEGWARSSAAFSGLTDPP